MSKEGEGMILDTDERLKNHIKEHLDEDNYELVIEMVWGLLKRQGFKCLNLK